MQTNGQIVVSKLKNVTSNFFTISVKRFSTFGVIDSTFGVSGESLVTFNTINTYLSSLAFQTDGKIVVAGGDESGKFVLARLNP